MSGGMCKLHFLIRRFPADINDRFPAQRFISSAFRGFIRFIFFLPAFRCFIRLISCSPVFRRFIRLISLFHSFRFFIRSTFFLPAFRGFIRLSAALQIFLQDLRNIPLTVVADHQVHTVIFQHPLCAGLYITARRHYHRLRIPFFSLVQHLPALSVRYIGNRAGIDDIDIGSFIKWHNRKALFPKLLPNNIQFIRINLASEVV